MLVKTRTFIRHEAVLCIAFLCAVVSVALTGNVADTLGFIDWRVIVLLFCLMAATCGLTESGAMTAAARRFVAGRHSKRVMGLILVMLPFFASMFVTNDVALLTFTPLAILACKAAGWESCLVRIIVLQAIAANLGGMVTPIGNPQNLFIFTTYDLTAGSFFLTLAPFCVLALAVLTLGCATFGNETSTLAINDAPKPVDKRRLMFHAVLFALSVLAVLRILPYQILLVIVVAALLAGDRRIFAKVDYPLLATFVCFFIFSGNVSNLPAAQDVLGGLMSNHPMLTSLFASQVISNVPAAVLLSSFTANWHSLLVGVDIGGLGTPIASLASLIALRLYLQTAAAKPSAFLKEFGIANVVVLALMVLLYAALYVA